MITPVGMTVEQYCDAIKNGMCHARMTFPVENIVLTDEDFEGTGIEIMDCMNPEEDLTFGTATSRELTAYLLKSSKTDALKWTNEFQLEFGADVNGSTVWITAGYFTGKRPIKANTDIIQFVAYDRMTKFDVIADDFLTSLDYTGGLTLGDIYDALCAYVGVTNVAGDEISAHMAIIYTASPFSATGMTCRQILQWIAEAAGCYAKFMNDGTLKMVWFSHHEGDFLLKRDDCYTVDISDIHWEQDLSKRKKWSDLEADKWADLEGLTWQDLEGYYSPTKINAVRLSSTLDGIGVVEPDTVQEVNIYTIVDNPFLYSGTSTTMRGYARNLFDRLSAFGSYIPVTVECEGNWLVEPGDIIEFEFAKDDTGFLPLFNITTVWNGGCKCTYETTGDTERQPVSSGNREKYSMGGKFHEIRKDVDELYSEINDPTTGLATILKQTVEGLQFVAEKKSRVYYSNTAPTGTQEDPLMEGDLWIDTAHNNKMYRYNGNAWENASYDDPDKYTVRSGVAISTDGVEISGGKYVKVSSDGIVDIQSENFIVDSARKQIVVRKPSSLGGAGYDSCTYDNLGARIIRENACDTQVWTYPDHLFLIGSGMYGNLDPYLQKRFGVVSEIYCALAGKTNPVMYFYPSNEVISHTDRGLEIGWDPSQDEMWIACTNANRMTCGAVWSYFKAGYFTYIYGTLANNSSRNVKDDIKDMPSLGERLDKLHPVTFTYKKDEDKKTRHGLIYEDTIGIMPEICIEAEEDEKKCINYVELVPMLLKEVQDLRKRVAYLEDKVDKLERK